jgi:hypothetical protein
MNDGPVRRALVVAWGNAAPWQLEVYERLLSAQGLATRTFIPDTRVGLTDPDEYARTLAAVAAALVAEGDAPRVVHLFSDNGFIGWSSLLDALAQSDAGMRVRDAIRGVTLDSSPGLWNVRGRLDFARRFALGITPAVSRRLGLGVRERVPLLTPALALGFVGYQFVYPRAVDYMLAAKTRVSAHQPRCPHLFLYGARDPLVLPRDVRAWIARQRDLGIEVEEHCFEEAHHVALYASEPERYREIVSAFIARVG